MNQARSLVVALDVKRDSWQATFLLQLDPVRVSPPESLL